MKGETVVAYDPGEMTVNRETHVLYADGSVKVIDAAELEREIARSERVRTGTQDSMTTGGNTQARRSKIDSNDRRIEACFVLQRLLKRVI